MDQGAELIKVLTEIDKDLTLLVFIGIGMLFFKNMGRK